MASYLWKYTKMEHPDKIEEQMLKNEARWTSIFNNLLGSGSKNQGIARSLGNGEYAIGSNKIAKLEGVTEDVFLSYDWLNGKLSFLAKGTWIARELKLQISHGVEQVISFTGDWFGGDFIGESFIGRFHGGRFAGGFFSGYKLYLADPSTFIQGRIGSPETGVLGLPKIDVTSLDASSQKKVVSLLELQVGHYCNLTDENGTTHSFRVTKSCDRNNMDFEIQEETGQKRAIRIPWNEIRRSDDPNMFRRLSSIRIGMKLQIPYLFANDRVGAIKNIEISTKPTMFGTTVDTYKLNFSLLRPMTFTVPETTVHLYGPDEVVRFGKMYQDLVNNGMQLHLRNITDGLKFNIITGWNGYPHLAPLFNGQKGDPVTHPKYAASMAWLDEFIQIVVLRMVKSRAMGGAYLPNEPRRKSVMDKLSEIIRNAMPSTPVTASKPATNTNSSGPVKPSKGRNMIP